MNRRSPQLRNHPLQQTLAGEQIALPQNIAHHGNACAPESVLAGLDVDITALEGRLENRVKQSLFAQHHGATPSLRTAALVAGVGRSRRTPSTSKRTPASSSASTKRLSAPTEAGGR